MSKKELIILMKKLNKINYYSALKTMERKWIEETKKLHVFNYWWYRYFTNEFELFLIKGKR